MMEHGIKTVAFKKGIRENELSGFINQLSKPSNDVADKGGWSAVIKKENMEHIGIDEVRFVSVDEYARESQAPKKLEDLMFIDFLLGKVDQKDMDKKTLIDNMRRDPSEIARAITDLANISAIASPAIPAPMTARSNRRMAHGKHLA